MTQAANELRQLSTRNRNSDVAPTPNLQYQQTTSSGVSDGAFLSANSNATTIAVASPTGSPVRRFLVF